LYMRNYLPSFRARPPPRAPGARWRGPGINGKTGQNERQSESTPAPRGRARKGRQDWKGRSVAPAAPVEQGGGQGDPAEGKHGGADEVEPVIPPDAVGQRGVEHARGVVLQRQVGEGGDAVLLADVQEQADGEEVDEGGHAGGALGARQGADGQADP